MHIYVINHNITHKKSELDLKWERKRSEFSFFVCLQTYRKSWTISIKSQFIHRQGWAYFFDCERMRWRKNCLLRFCQADIGNCQAQFFCLKLKQRKEFWYWIQFCSLMIQSQLGVVTNFIKSCKILINDFSTYLCRICPSLFFSHDFAIFSLFFIIYLLAPLNVRCLNNSLCSPSHFCEVSLPMTMTITRYM